MLFLNLLSLCLILPLLALCAEDYYKLLGVGKRATDKEIKKAYRIMSKKYHPDKNPNDEAAHQKFVEIADAYEALSDKEMRDVYDRSGHEGVEKYKQRKNGPQGARGGDPFDLFNRFFGGGGHFGGGRQRGPNMEVTIAIPLADFYNGIDSEFTVEKKQICEHCEGSGSDDGKMQTCNMCRGQGVVIQKAQLAPGIVQQIQTTCNQCGGAGQTIKSACRVCGGHRVVKQKELFQMSVEKGMPKGMRLVYENEGDASPDYEAGDLILTLVERQPSNIQEERYHNDGAFFRRKGNDLYWREVLSLREAWMGDWTRNLTHLDGRIVQLSRKRGEVVQPGAVEVIPNEGMPLWHGRIGEREEPKHWGNLLVEYVCVLPDKMESSMEKEMWSVWEKWRKKTGVNLDQHIAREAAASKGESTRDEL